MQIKPFANDEAEQFLSKIHKKEKINDIKKLSQALSNYPLALAQISNELLTHNESIVSFLEKKCVLTSEINAAPDLMSVDLNLIQSYDNNYQIVLNRTLQDIEDTDKKLAKVLYMLSLLNTDLSKKLVKNIFGEQIEESLIALDKHGIIQKINYEDDEILNIHDIIREEAIKRFNSKELSYKKKIIND
jgi:uncharacterized protein (DUF2225 family)